MPEHVPVMLDEVLQWLAPQPGQTFVDGTLGGGGHTRALAQCVGPSGRIIALDRDPRALLAAETNLAGLPIQIAHSNYRDLPQVLDELAISQVDGVLLDLGFSSDQLADPERGFSFEAEGPLDLRFDFTEGEPAWVWLRRLDARQLADIIYRYGEERFSRRIARRVVEAAGPEPLTARRLAAIVRQSVPRSPSQQRLDPATRTFQALRIAVNEELESLESGLRVIPQHLAPQGGLAVISFHSLEDRLVKEAFRSDPRLEPLTKKPVRPTDQEIDGNPRSRSAKLRVARRVA